MLKTLIKSLVFIVCVVVVAPAIVLSWLEKRLLRGEVVFIFFAQLLALVPGLPGSLLRGAYYFGTLDQASWQAHVGFGSIFTHRGASLGERASMGSYCVVGHARIGAEVMMGSRVSIPSGKRQHLDADGKLNHDTTRYDTVVIGERAWVGEGAIIMASVGGRSIVSAGTVVTSEMPASVLIGGNPARVIKELG